MMVMPACNSGAIVHYWAGRYPGRIGWIVGPAHIKKTKLRPRMPFVLDNDAFGTWMSKKPWDEPAWLSMLARVRATGLAPLWCLVPDVVADRDATLRYWDRFAPVAASYGWPLAFAVQDGMTPADVPPDCVVFVGGSTGWKWRSLPMWCAMGRRVHVGRVNEIDKLFVCRRLGVESVDGSGWMQGTENGRQARALAGFLSGEILEHPEFEL